MNVEGVVSGEDFEKLIFGYSHQEVQRICRIFSHSKNKHSLDESILYAKELHSLFGAYPKTTIGRVLFHAVQSKMGGYKKYLRSFPSIGTWLDFDYGIDAFYECNGHIASVDYTISRVKDNLKADVLITLDDLRSDRYQNKCSELARILLSKLAKKK